MKKILFSFLLISPVSLMAQTTVLSDNFDSYTVGIGVASQSPLWETWSGFPPEDPLVVDTLSSSDSNSINVYNLGAGNYVSDLILPFPSTYTSGIYEIRMKYYVPSGYGAYFNLGGVWVSGGAGYQYGIEVFFNGDASGKVNTPGTGVFSYVQDAWTAIRAKVNLNTDSCEVFINSVSVFNGPWNAAAGFGCLDIFAYADSDDAGTFEITSDFYADDVELLNWTGVGIDAKDKEANLHVYPSPSNGQFSIEMSNFNAGNYRLTITDVVGNLVHSESIQTTGTANRNLNLDIESGIYFVNIANGITNIQKRIVVK